ncbi:MAG: hypothetical protein GDA41_10145 [Rhodospirillales bacterium]|nr:hypothetical protein [Rhodospirillales bacterium]
MQKKIETCYLHIGLPKTGTTSLQAALTNSHRKLYENGILYPENKTNAHYFIVRQLKKASKKWPHFQSLEFNRKLSKKIETFSGDTMIISAETMSNLDRENCRKIVEYFSQYCNKMTVCAYLRNPFELISRLMHKKVNNNSAIIENLEKPLEIDTLPLNKECLSGWIGAAGLENMLVVPYDRERLIGGSTVTDFLARTGIDGALVEIPPQESNSSLTMTGMFVKNEMNKRARTKGLKLGKAAYLLSLPGPRFLPSKRFADAMQERCREDLAWLSATFAIGLANGSGGHRGPWQDYFTDEVKTVLKDMLDRGCDFGSAIEEQAFREVAEGILSGGIFARKHRVPPSPVADGSSGREIRKAGIDEGKSRDEHDRLRQVDCFRPEAGKASEDLIERRKAVEDRDRQNLKERQLARAAEEAAQDERRRPKGVAAFFARLTGKARRMGKEIADAQVRRAERNAAEWAELAKHQLEEARQSEPGRGLGEEERERAGQGTGTGPGP